MSGIRYKLGANTYIVKSVELNMFLEMVKTIKNILGQSMNPSEHKI
ncbi:MAG: hypothetical protein PVH88_26390 [Ignavibacteria bacterium]|jgi:hypothetical protein